MKRHRYQTKGTVPPVKYISDPEEFKVREQAYNDSLNLYEYHKQRYRDIARSNNADPSKYPYDLILKENEKFNTKGGAYKMFDTGESLYIASPEYVSAQRSKGYVDDFVFEDPKYIKESKIKPLGLTMQSFKDYNYLFKKPTQPVAQSTLEPSVIKPTITKVVKDSEGNIISTKEGISQEEAGKRFNPRTQSWEKLRYGGEIPKYQNGGTVKYQIKGTVEGRARDRFKNGGETDPPVKYISDPSEFAVRNQAYNDSLTAYLESVATFEDLGPLQIPMSSGTIPRFEDIPSHASTNPHRIYPEIYIPGQGAYDVYTGDKAKTEGYSRHFPSGNVIAPQVSLSGGASGNTAGSGASMGHDFYPKPKQPVAFRKKPAFSPNRISPRGSDDLAGYFRGGPGLKGAELETVTTKLQPIQSNWRPKSVGYTSNTAAGYPMIQRGRGTGRVPKGAYWRPGRGYEYTND